MLLSIVSWLALNFLQNEWVGVDPSTWLQVPAFDHCAPVDCAGGICRLGNAFIPQPDRTAGDVNACQDADKILPSTHGCKPRSGWICALDHRRYAHAASSAVSLCRGAQQTYTSDGAEHSTCCSTD